MSFRNKADAEGEGNDEEPSKVRNVTITGSPQAAQMAQMIISQKLSGANNESSGHGRGGNRDRKSTKN